MNIHTHAVTDYVAHLSNPDNYGYNETYAIHEGNSDYYAASYTGRTLLGEYSLYGYQEYQRDLSNPRIADYTQYNDPNLSYWQQYGYHEPHFGGELWSATLWDLRKSSTGVGQYYADMLTYRGLNGIPTNSSFLQYRQSIINADNNYYGGSHINTIRHVFYLRGIGADNLSVSISGPSSIYHPNKGQPDQIYTWHPVVSGGSSPYSYSWYWDGNYVGSGSSYSITLRYAGDHSPVNHTLRVNVNDGSSQYATYSKAVIEYYGGILPKQNGIAENSLLPEQFSVQQNYPNPFNPTTQINYALPTSAMVNIKVYDLLGREVRELINEQKEAGFYTINFNASNLSSGIYLYRIVAQNGEQILFTESKRMILMK